MSKRSAQGPQGDKDSNLFHFNMSSTPDDKPQRATAAQLASRRIKDVRKRPRATGAPSGSTGVSFGGPFSSIDPNTVSSTSASPQPPTNGFSFGQSQSFPPASSAPKLPAQNGIPQFAFGSGGNPSAFNFSSSFGGQTSTPASNPFSSLNTGVSSQQVDGANTSGFKGNMFNTPPTGSQSPAQQPLPSGGLFGAGSQQSGSAGGSFGSTTTCGASSQPGATASPNGNIFGQSSTGATPTNVFAQSGTNKPNSFTQSTAFGSDSMQTSPDAKSTAQKPSLFGSGSGGFGVSTNFGSSGTANLFNGAISAPTQTPSKPLFGAKPTEQEASASTSLFGATTQLNSASAPPSSSAAPSTTGTATSSLFSSPTSKPPATLQNPFQSTSLFGTPAPTTTQTAPEPKDKEETKASEPTPSQRSINFAPTTTDTSLFSKSGNTAPSHPSGGWFQAPSTGNIFSPKPASSTEQGKPGPAENNPFGNLFSPKPAATEKPNTEQQPLPSSSIGNMFALKPTPSEGAKTNESLKAATPTSPLSASTPAKSSALAPQSPDFSISTPQATTPAPAFSQSPFQINPVKPVTTELSASSTPSAPSQSFDKLRPTRMASGLAENTKEQVESLYRVRLLNESFRREVTKLDPTTQSFDALVQFYLRVRETIGAPVEGAGTKRKASADTTVDAQPAKKIKPFGIAEGLAAPTVASPSETSTPSQFLNQNTPTASNKRKATEDGDGDASSTQPSAKRTNGDSTTASIFANSFSRSKTSDSDEITATESPKKLDTPSLKSSTPEPAKSTLFSTTPTSSPTKPLFSTPTASQKTSASGSTPSQPMPTFKPTFTASTNSAPPTNPFVLKPSGDKGASAAAAPLAIPKFGSGNTNFFAQFKAQSDKEAEKEKEKRKAEDYDSESDDEEEWERKDAELQRKKREEIEAQKNRRARFIPGVGFSFDEENDSEKSDASAASSMASDSVFDAKTNTQAKSSNIFSHLSATPSESGEIENYDDADDTEEASASGDDAARESSFAPTEDFESSNADSKTNGAPDSSAPESSDEGDFTKALKSKKSESSTTTKEQAAAEQGPGSRSLFQRVQYAQEGKPKRQGEDDKTVSSLLGSSKYASSFSSSASTPNPFASLSQPQTDKAEESTASKPTPTNIFGSSTTTGNIFGGSTPATPGASTPSIFATGSSTTKSATDNTWKLNTPITFASDPAAAAASATKSDSESAPSASDSSKPFSALFGAPPAGSKSGSGSSQQSLGFSFGGPSQQSSSFLTPSVLTSATPSRASTPGLASDTGAEESVEGETAESLPQVDLARSSAGQENEDVLIETKSRALRWEEKDWETKGLGIARVLKDRTTSRARILIRADPSGTVILNAKLMKEVGYTASGTSIQFLVPISDGPPEKWALRVKRDIAAKFALLMEENKS